MGRVFFVFFFLHRCSALEVVQVLFFFIPAPTFRPWSGLRKLYSPYGDDGPLVLPDFDILQHPRDAEASKRNPADNLTNDAPVNLPERRHSCSASPHHLERLVQSMSPRASPHDLSTYKGHHRHDRPLSRACTQELEGRNIKRVTALRRTNDGKKTPKVLYTRAKVMAAPWNFLYIDWDGLSPFPTLDMFYRVIGVLGGQPNNPEYAAFTTEAAKELKEACEKMSWTTDDGDGCHGTFFAKTVGGSFGREPQFPGNLRQSPCNHIILDYLLLLLCFQRIAGFANSLLKTYNPTAHALYEATLNALIETGIIRNFDRSLFAFAATTFNFGPITITYPHLDGLNLAWGCAAGLFRWGYNGFKNDITIEMELSKMKGQWGQKACTDRQAARATRWDDGINSYMVWDAPTEASTTTA
ncbi:hypothetical protein C8J57DRAFT_1496288 [Mycena rebaudengoi]|nr:hypothetical protein C8J57DRAFT_1496288 [Mycena rebaudengoi]